MKKKKWGAGESIEEGSMRHALSPKMQTTSTEDGTRIPDGNMIHEGAAHQPTNFQLPDRDILFSSMHEDPNDECESQCSYDGEMKLNCKTTKSPML